MKTEFFFDKNRLDKIAEEKASAYQQADPARHTFIDNVFPDEVAEEIYEQFPGEDDIEWMKKDKNQHEFKSACEDPEQFPPVIRRALEECNSSAFLNFLEKLTGIEGLIPDPHYRGGGLHRIVRGGFLKVHVDFNWYPRLRLERRVNVILFFNKDWKEEYGGYFELWDKEMKNAEVKVAPIFNRAAIFSTSEDSYHGHPDPLKFPEGVARQSLALYYYTSPATDDQARAKAHTTVFKKRPGEFFQKKKDIKDIIKLFVPPICIKIVKKMKW